MLSSSLQTILDNRLRYLPEITGKAIQSVDWPNKLIELSHKYGLHIDDTEELQMVVLKSMTGLLPPGDFENNLISATAVSPATADQMIADINGQIFEPIHDFVMNQGKKPDAMAQNGIVLQPDADVAVPLPPQKPASMPRPAASLEIPASPEPAAKKPAVSGNFDDFFMLK